MRNQKSFGFRKNVNLSLNKTINKIEKEHWGQTMPFWKTTLKNKDLIPDQICSHSGEVQRSSTQIWKLRHAWYSNSSSSIY